MSEEKETIEWNFMEEDEAVFIKKMIGLIHTYYTKQPTDFIIIAAWLMKKRLVIKKKTRRNRWTSNQ